MSMRWHEEFGPQHARLAGPFQRCINNLMLEQGSVSMIDLSRLRLGLTGYAEIMVGEEHTAPRIGSGRVSVLATSVVINVMQVAALDAIERLLPEGHQSIGIGLDVRHYAATPMGMRLTATAELLKIEGRTLYFRVEARDELECVGDGRHERFVLNVNRFEDKIRRKMRGSISNFSLAENLKSIQPEH